MIYYSYRYISIIFFTAFAISATGQTNNVANNPYSQVSIASPTAGSLGKYADIPVNYHTGIPQISIPIYTVKSGPLSLPISLSYHASGLKVQEPASWVGAGWALNAGGVITRTVIGAPDEKGTNNAGLEADGHFSDYGYSNYMYQSGIEDWQAFADGRKDGEPDLYFFNFNGYTGKFYFNDDRTPVIVPEQDFKIVPSYSSTGSESIQSFIITTPDGVKYSFGNSPGVSGSPPIEITNPVTTQNGLSTGKVISSWYLNKIASADNQFSINLSYTEEKYGYFTIAMFPVDGEAIGNDGYGYNLVKNIVKGVRLSNITFPNNGAVNFLAGSIRTDLGDDFPSLLVDGVNYAATTLGSIQIKDGVIPTLCKNYNFSYDYFPADNSAVNATGITSLNNALSTDKTRLRLNSVQEISCDNSATVPPYLFTYFGGQVPRRLSFGIDHWGFNNGASSNDALIPTYTVISSNNTRSYTGANRNANFPAMLHGTLSQISYPTGGNSSFGFESNNVLVNSSLYQEVSIANLLIAMYGQTNISQTATMLVTGNGDCEINAVNNNIAYSPYLSVKNSSSTEVVGTYIANAVKSTSTPGLIIPGTYHLDKNLTPGTYFVTLAFPSGFPTNSNNYPPEWGSTVGSTASVSQWKYNPYTETKTVGGLRISSITHNDGITTNNSVTSYDYTYPYPNSTSTAVLYSRPVYVGIERNDLIRDIGYWHPDGHFEASLSPNGCPSILNASFYKSPSSVRPMGTTQGYFIGYNQVKVSQSGNGYSIYNYYSDNAWQVSTDDVAVTTVNTNGCDGNAPNYPPAPLPFEFKRGELQSESHYNNNDELLQNVTYAPVYENNTVTTPGFIVVARHFSGVTQLLGTKYNLVNARKTQMTTIKTENTPGVGSVVTTTTDKYESAFHHQPTTHTVVTSTGDNLTSFMKYSSDFRIVNCDNINTGWQTYTTNCNTCQTNYNTTRSGCSADATCLTNAYLNYLECLIAKRVEYVNYQKTNFTDPTNTFATNHDAAKTAANAELQPILELQDEYKNPVIETSTFKNSNLLSASFNRFDYGMNNSTFVYPNKLQTLFPSTLATTFINAETSSSGTSVTKDIRYTDEAFYKFNAGNPAEATGKDGVTTSYIWGYSNTLPIVKAVGVDAATLNAAYTAAGNSLTQLRSQSSLSNALISTYTYSPLLGITSETDPSGKTIYYQYDPLGRLSIIKDQNGYVIKKNEYKYIGQ